MTNDDLKNTWEKLDERIARLEAASPADLSIESASRRITALDRLAHRYLVFSRISLLCIILAFTYMHGDFIPEYCRIPVAVFMAVYFAAASAMDYWLYKKVSGIDIRRMGVEKVAKAAYTCRKRHHQFMFVLIPFAFIFIGTMIYIFSDISYMVIAIAIGAIAGLAIGLRSYLDFMNDYRSLF